MQGEARMLTVPQNLAQQDTLVLPKRNPSKIPRFTSTKRNAVPSIHDVVAPPKSCQPSFRIKIEYSPSHTARECQSYHQNSSGSVRSETTTTDEDCTTLADTRPIENVFQRRCSSSSYGNFSNASWHSSDSSTICATARSSTVLSPDDIVLYRKPKSSIDDLLLDIRNGLECLDIDVTRLTLRHTKSCQRSRGSGNTPPVSSSESSASRPNGRVSSQSLVPAPLGRSKRHYEGGDGADENDEEDRKRRKLPSAVGNEESDTGSLLACPFFIYDRQKHQNCKKYILRDLGALRAHLSRKHNIGPDFCDRCYRRFDTQGQRQKHYKEETCDPNPHKSREYEVYEKIKGSRKKKSQPLEHAWFDIYGILFPDAHVPRSAYLEEDDNDSIVELLSCLSERNPHLDFAGLDISAMSERMRQRYLNAVDVVQRSSPKANEDAGPQDETQGETTEAENATKQIDHAGMNYDGNYHVPQQSPTDSSHISPPIACNSGNNTTNTNSHFSQHNRMSVPDPIPTTWAQPEPRPFSFPMSNQQGSHFLGLSQPFESAPINNGPTPSSHEEELNVTYVSGGEMPQGMYHPLYPPPNPAPTLQQIQQYMMQQRYQLQQGQPHQQPSQRWHFPTYGQR